MKQEKKGKKKDSQKKTRAPKEEKKMTRDSFQKIREENKKKFTQNELSKENDRNNKNKKKIEDDSTKSNNKKTKFDRSILRNKNALKKLSTPAKVEKRAISKTQSKSGSKTELKSISDKTTKSSHSKKIHSARTLILKQPNKIGLELDKELLSNPHVKLRKEEEKEILSRIKGELPPSNPEIKKLSIHKMKPASSDIIKSIFLILNNIDSRIKEILSERQYIIYNYYNEQTKIKELYLVPEASVPLIKQLRNHSNVNFSGIYFGYLIQGYSKNNIKLEKRFNLSLEGGSFLYSICKDHYPEIYQNLPILKVNPEGEKKFLYGNNLDVADFYESDKRFKKYTPIFVVDEYDDYLGLCLLMVKQAGSERTKKIHEKLAEIENLKKRKNYNEGELDNELQIEDLDLGLSDSKNFIVKIQNLTDLGKYLRGGRKVNE